LSVLSFVKLERYVPSQQHTTMSVPDEGAVLDAEDDEVDAPHHVTSDRDEQRRAQNAIFDLWLTSRTAQNVLNSTATPKAHSLADDHQSIAQLLANQQSSPIVKNPRDYQLQLFERAKTANTIACLDTGSGKTLIAVLLLRHIIDKELEDRAAGKSHKIAFFLCCSVALAYQQFSVLETNLDHSVARLVGDDNADQLSRPDWQQQLALHKVIVCTPAILEQCLARGHLTMKQINLLVIDEAHHTKKNHPYAM
jgi:endoribonuclease Dicer